jgi:hypothetical protein
LNHDVLLREQPGRTRPRRRAAACRGSGRHSRRPGTARRARERSVRDIAAALGVNLRRRSRSDRRVVCVALTPAGKAELASFAVGRLWRSGNGLIACVTRQGPPSRRTTVRRCDTRQTGAGVAGVASQRLQASLGYRAATRSGVIRPGGDSGSRQPHPHHFQSRCG